MTTYTISPTAQYDALGVTVQWGRTLTGLGSYASYNRTGQHMAGNLIPAEALASVADAVARVMASRIEETLSVGVAAVAAPALSDELMVEMDRTDSDY